MNKKFIKLKKQAMLLPCVLFLISCQINNKNISFQEFKSIEFCYLNKVENGNIFIKNINNYTNDRIFSFAYCLAVQNNLNSVTIDEKLHFTSAIWVNDNHGKTLYKMHYKMIDISPSDTLIILEKRFDYILKLENGLYSKMEIKEEYYNCD